MFCLEEDCPRSANNNNNGTGSDSDSDNIMIGHTWLIPIPRTVLRYKNMRRNTKLFKYHGYLLFPSAQRIIWQDAKFFQRVNIRQQPTDYSLVNYNEEACVTVMSLPIHPNTFGVDNIRMQTSDSLYRPQYIDHCSAILGSPF
jgi:hypothetical protein